MSGIDRKSLIIPKTTIAPADEFGLFVSASDVFPGAEATERRLVQLLSTLSRDDTLFQCARLNILISGLGDFEIEQRQLQAIALHCMPEHLERIRNFARQHKMSGLPAVFFRGQMLELMRWVARYSENLPGDGTTYQDPTLRARFLEVALIASDLWGKRTYRDRLSGGHDLTQARLRAMGPFRKGMEEANLAPHLGLAIGRGIKLFSEYLPRHFPEFAEQFQRVTGLTVRQYLGCATLLSMYTLQHRAEGPLFNSNSIAERTTYRDVFPQFFALEAQSPRLLRYSFWTAFNTVGYRGLWERPIMILDDGRGIILDPTFFVERLSIGALFHVVKGKPRAEGLRAFSAFGDAFEEYATDILRRMYPPSPNLVDRVEFGINGCDAHGKTFEVDALLLDISQAVVFEMKAAFLREDAISDDDPETLVAELRAKYGAGSKRGERDKGVAQLARSIGAIVRNEFMLKGQDTIGYAVLYPVLVVHDTRLDTPAIGHFLESEFRSLLGGVPQGRRVAPLTIMTIQDLEHLEKSVQAFNFVKLLEDYSRDHPDRMRSLHNYIVFSKYGRDIRPSDYLMDASLGILDVMREELFVNEIARPPGESVA